MSDPDLTEELATAIVVSILAARPAVADEPPPATSRWADPADRLRHPLTPGTDAWRFSLR